MSSPFDHVLFTNYAPTASESAQIRDFCSKNDTELEQLNAEIAKLQDALITVMNHRDAIQRVVDSHRALLSPVHRMPTEILQRIFSFCPHSKRNPVMHPSEAPLLLICISQRWRTVAMGTPELWSSIHIVGSQASGPIMALDANAECVMDWLDRSGELPLNISLCSPEIRGNGIPSWFLSASIRPYSWRRSQVELDICRSQISAFRGLTANDVPLLESLVLCDITPADQIPSGHY